MCIQSMLYRHKSENTMISGTLNKEHVFDKIHHTSFIIDYFEVGSL